jgi:general secretion pathway protein D
MRTLSVGSLLAAALAALAGCSNMPQDSQALIEQGNHREGLARLEQAMRERPGDVERRIQYMRARDQVVGRLLAQAASEFAAARHDNTADLLHQVLGIDANNARATAGLAAIDAARRHEALARDAKAKLDGGDALSADLMVRAILAENPNHAAARELDRELRERERARLLAAPALKSRLQSPINLEFRDAPLKTVMEALARSVGINFIFDREVRPDLRASIFVRSVRVEDALDLIIQNLQLEKKVLTENTILIYPSTPQKLREHQELVMRTFHLGNADPKQTLALLRTMLKTKDIFVDERVNMLVMRDTPDVIRAAEKLIAEQDRIDPEVMLELEILEVSRSKVRELGITYPSTFTGPGGSLADIGDLTRATIRVDSGFGLKLLRTDGDTKTLANPRVRVRSKEKARVHVGDRVPVISSTIVGTTAAGAGGNAPVTTEQIQYLDVGIKIEAEPTVHPDDTVAIKINLDVSSLGAQIKTNAGTTAYEVGTRNASTVLRLRDGETQALMGLIRDEDVQAGAGLPYLGEAPVLNRIFGNHRTDRRSRELILLITPQLVRAVERSDATLSEFWSGTETAVRTRAPFVQPVADKEPRAGAVTPPATAAAAATTAAADLAPAKPLILSWAGPTAFKADEAFAIELKASSESALRGASVQLRYDPAQLEVLKVEDGGYFAQAGGGTVFTPRIDPTLGVVFVTLGTTGATAAKGDGALLKLTVKPRQAAAGASLQIGSVIGVDPANRRVPIEGSKPFELKAQP